MIACKGFIIVGVFIGFFRAYSCEDTKCYDTWTQYGEQCYHYSSAPLTMSEAKNSCQNWERTWLVSVTDQGVNDFLYENRPSSVPYWIGLDTFPGDSWGWNDGKIDNSIPWWDNELSSESPCAALRSVEKKFQVKQCFTQYPFICERDTEPFPIEMWISHQSKWYYLNTTSSTQMEAARTCTSNNAYLARLKAEAEVEFASSLISGHAWVGLTRLVWDGTEGYNWNNFLGPDDTSPNDLCVVMDDSGSWQTTSCESSNYYICARTSDLMSTIYTHGGSVPDGSRCFFPFIFEGRPNYECTERFNDALWCGTTYNFDDDYEWGYCILDAVTSTTQLTSTKTSTTTKTVTTTSTTSSTTSPSSSSVSASTLTSTSTKQEDGTGTSSGQAVTHLGYYVLWIAVVFGKGIL